MGMSAARRTGPPVARVRPLIAHPVHMVADRVQVVVYVRIEMPPGLPDHAGAGNDVVQVRNDAGRQEQLSIRIPIQSPGIAGAVRKYLENVLRRVIPPYARIELRALGVFCARFANVRVGEHAVGTVEPAVRSPHEGIQRLVGVVVAEPVQQHLRGACGPIPRCVDRDVEQIGRRSNPYSPESQFQAAHQIQPLHEDFPHIESPVSIGVFEDENPVFSFAFRRPDRVGPPLDDPYAPPVVERHRNGIDDIRFRRRQLHAEAVRYGHRLCGVQGASSFQ